MSVTVQCPICNHTSTTNLAPLEWGSLTLGDKTKKICPCLCGRTIWIEDKGWQLSWEFIKNLKERMWNESQALHNHLKVFLEKAAKEEVEVAIFSLDKSIVKLYCPNDQCEVEGFLSRTKLQAEKTTHFCDVCHSVLTW